ncbi:XRCC5 [Bugula neritina]|uniref:XRCC5 n=1 Tax=Bugula neritina TaxID=10212 RepID=A0A7J7J4I8_BUGNE|nr:XRCC5 [Bugula neritina]
MLVQRKIFSESDDKVCLFTYGSTGTANELASGNNYEHISMERDLRKADWGLCSHIQNTIQATDHEVDFMDALIVTSTYLINQINSINDKKEKKKISEGRRLIMVFSNLDNPVATDVAEMKDIIEGFKDNKIEIHFIGPNLSSAAVEDDNQPGPSTGASNSSNGGILKRKQIIK